MQSSGSANGPPRRTDWNSVNWRQAARIVKNLRQRIFRAARANDLRKVRSLQKLMLRCYSNILMSIRRVTQTNAGKYTPGVDKLVVKTPGARGELVDRLATYQPWRVQPVRRVYIPKRSDSSKLRPLGIPTVTDRCLQAMVTNALEPEWESRFEDSSYGFRPKRSVHDAVARVYLLALPHKKKKWVVDADIKGAFDNLSQDFLLKALGDVPGRGLIKQWLQAGYLEEGRYHDTPTGTPQGGVISPLLLNIALHGLERAVGVLHDHNGAIMGPRAVVRYADDFVVLCESKEDALRVKEKLLPPWLAERGLTLSEEKTRLVHLTEGFDFLGFNLRHYRDPQSRWGFKLRTRPSREAVTAKRQELREIWLSLRGHNLHAVLNKLNPIIRGWARFYRTAASTRTFRSLDHWMHHRALRYARHTHPNKSWAWLYERYWGRLNKTKKDKWVFGDKSSGRYLLKFSWTKIERHSLVRGTASADDPEMRGYWWERRKIEGGYLDREELALAKKQDWVCPVCGMELFNGEELHRHHQVPRARNGSEERSNRQLVHLYCHLQETKRQYARGELGRRPADEPRS